MKNYVFNYFLGIQKKTIRMTFVYCPNSQLICINHAMHKFCEESYNKFLKGWIVLTSQFEETRKERL